MKRKPRCIWLHPQVRLNGCCYQFFRVVPCCPLLLIFWMFLIVLAGTVAIPINKRAIPGSFIVSASNERIAPAVAPVGIKYTIELKACNAANECSAAISVDTHSTCLGAGQFGPTDFGTYKAGPEYEFVANTKCEAADGKDWQQWYRLDGFDGATCQQWCSDVGNHCVAYGMGLRSPDLVNACMLYLITSDGFDPSNRSPIAGNILGPVPTNADAVNQVRSHIGYG